MTDTELCRLPLRNHMRAFDEIGEWVKIPMCKLRFTPIGAYCVPF